MDVIGVVPIFMSAGAAVLPTVLAAVTSVAAVLLKPREFFRLIRQNPRIAAASTAACAVAISASIWWWMAPAKAGAAHPAATSKYDWATIARQIIKKEEAGKTPTVIAYGDVSGSATVLGHDFSRSSYSGGAAPEQLRADWEFNEPGLMVWSVAMSGKTIFAAGCQNDTPPFGRLLCINSEGKEVWRVDQVKDDYLHPVFSCPAITADGKYLVVGEGLHEDRDCQLRCFDAHTGESRWAVKTSLHIESSPAILGDMVVVGCGAIEGTDGKATGDPGHVLAVRISDGNELWRQPVNDPESSPAIDETGMVYIGSGFNGNALVAIRSESDEVLRERKLPRIAWKTDVAQPVTSAITLVGDLVIAGASNSDFAYANPNPEGWVIALDRKTGKSHWEKKFADAVLGALAARDGKIICPLRTGEVAALDLAGNLLWQTPISGKTPILAGCAFTGKRVYAISSDGYLAVLDANTGKILGKRIYINDQKTPGSGKCFAAPQVGEGRVIVGSETGGLRCYVGTRSAE